MLLRHPSESCIETTIARADGDYSKGRGSLNFGSKVFNNIQTHTAQDTKNPKLPEDPQQLPQADQKQTNHSRFVKRTKLHYQPFKSKVKKSTQGREKALKR